MRARSRILHVAFRVSSNPMDQDARAVARQRDSRGIRLRLQMFA